MKIRITMVIDDAEAIELLSTERDELQADNIGFSIAEVKSLIGNGQKHLVNAQESVKK